MLPYCSDKKMSHRRAISGVGWFWLDVYHWALVGIEHKYCANKVNCCLPNCQPVSVGWGARRRQDQFPQIYLAKQIYQYFQSLILIFWCFLKCPYQYFIDINISKNSWLVCLEKIESIPTNWFWQKFISIFSNPPIYILMFS